MRSSLRDPEPLLACVVLAAGGSSRLGRPKQLLRLGAKPLLTRVVELGERVAPGRVVVVLGADQLRLRRVLGRMRARPRVVYNPAWRSGLASSLRAGLDAVPARAAGTLILLTDQPRVGAEAIARLVAAWRRRPTRAAAAAYAGRVGVPAILPRGYARALGRGGPDTGARALLAADPELTSVSVPEAAVDIDTDADWEAFIAPRASALPARPRRRESARNR